MENREKMMELMDMQSAVLDRKITATQNVEMATKCKNKARVEMYTEQLERINSRLAEISKQIADLRAEDTAVVVEEVAPTTVPHSLLANGVTDFEITEYSDSEYFVEIELTGKVDDIVKIGYIADKKTGTMQDTLIVAGYNKTVNGTAKATSRRFKSRRTAPNNVTKIANLIARDILSK